jgi:hypothetical protein
VLTYRVLSVSKRRLVDAVNQALSDLADNDPRAN